MTSPIERLRRWLEDAKQGEPFEADSMVLATVSAEGGPSARVVSCRGIDESGVRFFTHYEARKAVELAENPGAAIVFFWPTLRRQVRIEGRVEKLPAAESDAHFAARPRERQLTTWASPQSRPIDDLDALRARIRALDEQYRGRLIPRPSSWGGYLLRPHSIEFFVSAPDRVHDRRLFVREAPPGAPQGVSDEVWSESRLAP
ncbi:MAG TPA: pyridoxamine 5'-phosphate oxidase [Polyangiaceae bacterium]|nr:pyridoxamine 5'-phosphate oxidase [Polyangiaceae bacterium]